MIVCPNTSARYKLEPSFVMPMIPAVDPDARLAHGKVVNVTCRNVNLADEIMSFCHIQVCAIGR